ncbi:MAG: fatty acid desaturase [Deltaproteobacteria bacterium]|nr:fatty acid desaturase [Deltaproteobacteria bacterium]
MRTNAAATDPLTLVTPLAPALAPTNAIERETDRIDWVTSVPFIGMHVAAVAGLFYFPLTWKHAALAVGLYYLRMFGITAGFHRYFSHRTYKMGRAMQFAMAFLGTLSVQKGVLWWAAHHRHHHKFSDKVEDVHSPVQRGFWWSHVGWILAKTYEDTDFSQVRDLTKYPELVWLNKYHVVPAFVLGTALVLAGGWAAFFWGFVVSTVVLWHGTFTVNSLTHVFGKKRYDSGDESRNSFLIALITLGEGWHNNHHHYMSSTRQGFFWWELDGSYYALKLLEKVGLVSDLREPPAHLLT